MKLLLDEMWPPEIAVQLRRRNHDVVGVAERPELRGQPDALIFANAQTEGRAIVTENVIDYRLLASYTRQGGGAHAGLIFTSNRRFPRHDSRTIGRMVTALNQLLQRGPQIANQEYWLS